MTHRSYDPRDSQLPKPPVFGRKKSSSRIADFYGNIEALNATADLFPPICIGAKCRLHLDCGERNGCRLMSFATDPELPRPPGL
jgi:hypothetical protein